jgi:hypothetical protein
MAIRASEVIGPLVEEDLMTCKNGCSKLGVSKFVISVSVYQPPLYFNYGISTTDLYTPANRLLALQMRP